MDARLLHVALVVAALGTMGATHSTPNFVVEAPTEELAKKVALKAEQCRDEIALDWLGHTLPRWYKPCQVRVKVGQIGAGGATTFAFDRGHVFGWNMNVQGTEERILDSVIPHEVSHTIFASHFRRPLPRWADEGAATLVEHESERYRQKLMLAQVFKTSQRIPLKRLLAMKEYPSDMQSVLTLYAQGYSLADYLVQNGGKTRYLQFLEDAHHRDWTAAIQSFYGLKGIDDLETRWSGWVMAGSPSLNVGEGEQLADAGSSQTEPEVTVRSQSPEAGASAKPLPVKPTQPANAARASRSKGEASMASLGARGSNGGSLPQGNDLTAPDPRRRNPLTDEVFAASDDARTAPASPAAALGSAGELGPAGADSRRRAEPDDDDRDAEALANQSRRLKGRRRTLNEGWVPVSAAEPRRGADMVAAGNRHLPLTTLSVADHAATHDTGGQHLPTGRSTLRSGYPQSRSGSGSPQLGATSDFPSSP